MITIAAHWRASPLLRTARHRWCRQRIFPLLAVIKPNNAWFAGRAQAKGKAEVLKRFAPVARSVSWNVTAVAGNAWRILTSRIPDMSSTRHWRIITADGFSIGGGVAVFFWAPIRVEFSDGRRWRRNDDHDKVVGLTTAGA